jgi:hypothetical protein
MTELKLMLMYEEVLLLRLLVVNLTRQRIEDAHARLHR